MAPPISFGLGLSLARAGGAALDADAAAYIAAVETADGQALESGVRKAINNFVVGCKGDGIWDAIKASCILAGARTLDGALVPLVGTAPTNNNFVSGDYNRETGLIGDGSTKYLDSNRNNNADPQDDNHNATYLTDAQSGTYFGVGANNAGANMVTSTTVARSRSRCTTLYESSINIGTGLAGISRNASTGYTLRCNGTSDSVSDASDGLFAGNITIFSRIVSGSPVSFTASRISFYSIGESLDLALLDTRVSNLMTEIATAIP